MVEGFTVGIALLIFLQQVPPALGVAKPDGENTAASRRAAVGGWDGRGWTALALVVLVAVVMVVAAAAAPRAARLADRGRRRHRARAELAGLDARADRPHPVGAADAGLPASRAGHLSRPGVGVFAVAALAALESLLSAKVADGMADGERHDPDRELVGQGLANIAVLAVRRDAGDRRDRPHRGQRARRRPDPRRRDRPRRSSLVARGAGAGAAARADPARRAGGRADGHRGAHGRVRHRRAGSCAPRAATRCCSCSPRRPPWPSTSSTPVGRRRGARVAAGAARRGRQHALRARGRSTPATSTRRSSTRCCEEHIVAYRLDGALFFGAAQRFLLELTEVSDVEVVILRLGRLRVLDSTGAQALADLVRHLQDRGITVLLASLRPGHRRLLERVGVLESLAHENHSAADDRRGAEARPPPRRPQRPGASGGRLGRTSPRGTGRARGRRAQRQPRPCRVRRRHRRSGSATPRRRDEAGSGCDRLRLSGGGGAYSCERCDDRFGGLALASLGSARRKTFFHAEATCLGSGPLV